MRDPGAHTWSLVFYRSRTPDFCNENGQVFWGDCIGYNMPKFWEYRCAFWVLFKNFECCLVEHSNESIFLKRSGLWYVYPTHTLHPNQAASYSPQDHDNIHLRALTHQVSLPDGSLPWRPLTPHSVWRFWMPCHNVVFPFFISFWFHAVWASKSPCVSYLSYHLVRSLHWRAFRPDVEISCYRTPFSGSVLRSVFCGGRDRPLSPRVMWQLDLIFKVVPS